MLTCRAAWECAERERVSKVGPKIPKHVLIKNFAHFSNSHPHTHCAAWRLPLTFHCSVVPLWCPGQATQNLPCHGGPNARLMILPIRQLKALVMLWVALWAIDYSWNNFSLAKILYAYVFLFVFKLNFIQISFRIQNKKKYVFNKLKVHDKSSKCIPYAKLFQNYKMNNSRKQKMWK